MHLDGLGDIRQHHRFHKLFAFVEKGLLLFNDAAADAQQGIVAALQALNQPFGFLKIAADKLAVGVVARAAAHGSIVLVNLQARNAVSVQLYRPAAIMLAHQHIGDHILRLTGLDRLARARIQGLDQIHRLFQHLFLQAGNAHQGTEIVVGQQIEVIADDQFGFGPPRGIAGELGELDQQAVAQIPCRHAHRIETLDAFQHRLDLIQPNVAVAHAVEDILQRDGQVAGLIHGVDNRGRNSAIGIGEGGQLHLPHQVVLQRLGSFALVDGKLVVLIVHAVA